MKKTLTVFASLALFSACATADEPAAPAPDEIATPSGEEAPAEEAPAEEAPAEEAPAEAPVAEDGQPDEAGAIDKDGDGVGSAMDCDDNNPDIHPDAKDIPNDGIDQDCDGTDAIE